MVLSFSEMKELEELKHKNTMEQLKAKGDQIVMDHTYKSERLDKLLEYISKGGALLKE